MKLQKSVKKIVDKMKKGNEDQKGPVSNPPGPQVHTVVPPVKAKAGDPGAPRPAPKKKKGKDVIDESKRKNEPQKAQGPDLRKPQGKDEDDTGYGAGIRKIAGRVVAFIRDIGGPFDD